MPFFPLLGVVVPVFLLLGVLADGMGAVLVLAVVAVLFFVLVWLRVAVSVVI